MNAQKHEFGFGAGTSAYYGDINPGFRIKNFRLGGSVFYKKNPNHYFAYRQTFTYGRITGADSLYKGNQLRNLSFFADIFEFNSGLDFHFMPLGLGIFEKRMTPYFTSGISLFYFDPKVKYRTEIRKLRPLGTEGQFLRHNSTYQKVQLGIPIGLGVKLMLSKNWVLGFECAWRKTWTDHLDDLSNGYRSDLYDNNTMIYTGYPDATDMLKYNQVNPDQKDLAVQLSDRSGEINPEGNLGFDGKQRGNPSDRDWFYLAQFTLSYRIVKYNCAKGGF